MVFPKVLEAGAVRPTEAVLVQTFEPGVPLMDWAASRGVSAEAKKVLRRSLSLSMSALLPLLVRNSRPGLAS